MRDSRPSHPNTNASCESCPRCFESPTVWIGPIFSVVRTLNVKLGATITITVHVTGDAELETWAAAGRADLFERVFRRRVKFSVIVQDEAA